MSPDPPVAGQMQFFCRIYLPATVSLPVRGMILTQEAIEW